MWDILTNLPAYSQWNPFIVQSEGTVQTGRRIKNTMKNGNSTITFKPKVLVVEKPKAFEWLGALWVKGLFDGHHYFHIEALPGDRINLVHAEKFSGILASMMLKKIGDDTRNNFVKMNHALKTLAEKQ